MKIEADRYVWGTALLVTELVFISLLVIAFMAFFMRAMPDLFELLFDFNEPDQGFYASALLMGSLCMLIWIQITRINKNL